LRIAFAALIGLGVAACGSAHHDSSAAAGGGASAAGTGPTGGVGGAAAGSAAGGSPATSGAAGSAAGAALGGTATTGGSGGAANGGTATTGLGTVQFGRLLPPASSTSTFDASARFYAPTTGTGFDCAAETFGGCNVSVCTAAAAAAAAPPNAGNITFSDGQAINLMLAAMPGQQYGSLSASPPLLGGEIITVTAAGADVPAFSATVAVPLVIRLTSPVLDMNGLGTSPRDQDLVLTFDNRASDGETGTQLYVQASAPAGFASIQCTLPTDSGTATIPKAALGKLVAGTDLLLLATRTKQVVAGDYSVSVVSYISAMNPAKSRAARIQLQ